jgi:peptide subunit release factor 1 (eRF1)
MEHLHRIIEHVWAIDRSRPIHSLILSGPDEAVTALRRLLPKALARAVAGVVHMDLDLPTPEVVRQIEELDAEGRAAEDRAMVADLVTRAAKQNHAITGWSPTLEALSEGRVHLLAIADQEARPGSQCPEGHFLTLGDVRTCPYCEEPLWHVDDIVEAAIRIALASDAQVRFVSGVTRGELGGDGVGAELRW